MSAVPDDPLFSLNRDRDLARLRAQAIEREVADLLAERDRLIGKIAVWEHQIDVVEGSLTSPDVARRELASARSRLDGRN